MRKHGFTLVEMLIALAVIGIALAGLAAAQFTALRTNTQSQALSDSKAVANLLLERLATDVLRVTPVPKGTGFDDDGKGHRYSFIDYFWSCPTAVAPKGNIRKNASVKLPDGEACMKTYPASNGITTSFAIRGGSGILGEGVVNIAVTATHDQGVSVTVGTSITCFEVYPAPTSEAPAPCPLPTSSGGGRGA